MSIPNAPFEKTIAEEEIDLDLKLLCDDNTNNYGFYYQHGADTLLRLQQDVAENKILDPHDEEKKLRMDHLLQLCLKKYLQGGDYRRMKLDYIKIIKQLGKGEHGRVYDAIFKPPGEHAQRVAVKKVLAYTTSQLRGAEIYRERDIHIYLGEHKRILKIIGCFFARMTIECYFVLQVARGSLQSINSGSLPNVHRARFMRHLLEGVEWMHNKQVIHNDLGPSNLLITYENNLVVADFGSALFLPKGVDAVLSNTALGVLGFKDIIAMSENLYSRASDIFAVACVLYEIELGGDHLLKYKFLTSQIPDREYINVIHFGKLSQNDAETCFKDYKGSHTSSIRTENFCRTPLSVWVAKSGLRNILTRLMDLCRHNRPSATDILQDKEFQNFIRRLGCTEEIVDNCKKNKHLVVWESSLSKASSEFRTSYLTDDELRQLDSFSLEGNTHEGGFKKSQHKAPGSIQKMDRAMCGIYYDHKVANEHKLREICKHDWHQNYVIETTCPLKAIIRENNYSESIKVSSTHLKKNICEGNLTTSILQCKHREIVSPVAKFTKGNTRSSKRRHVNLSSVQNQVDLGNTHSTPLLLGQDPASFLTPTFSRKRSKKKLSDKNDPRANSDAEHTTFKRNVFSRSLSPTANVNSSKAETMTSRMVKAFKTPKK